MIYASRQLPVAVLVGLVVALAAASHSVTINVPSDYGQVQTAVEASGPGDTVLVEEGTYYERIRFPQHPLIVGSRTLIDGDTLHALFTTINADTSVIGRADTACAVFFPPGLDSTSRLIGLTITNGIGLLKPGQSLYRYGGGTYCDSSSPIIESCRLVSNQVTSSGGAVLLSGGSTAIIRGCTFEANSAVHFGGALEAFEATPLIEACRFESNSVEALGTGGAIDLWDSPAYITDCWFEGNEAGFAGGAMSWYNSPGEIVYSVVDLSTSFYGGAMYIYGSTPKLSHLTVIRSDGRQGGSFYMENADPSISNLIIANGLRGSAMIALFESNPNLSCCDIYNNPGGDWFGYIADQLGMRGNFSGDPLFCGVLEQDYSIDINSPCAPGGSCTGLIGAIEPACEGVLGTIMVPGRCSVIEGNSVPPRMASIFIGNFSGDISAQDIDLGSLAVNDTLMADSVRVLPGHPEFAGEVVEMVLPLKTVIDHYGSVIWDTLAAQYTISGSTAGGPLELSGLVTILGHISGDLNRDGSRDISDLVAMVDYFFHGGSPPAFPAAADLNHDGLTDIADLVGLVGKLFPPQPEPLPPRQNIW